MQGARHALLARAGLADHQDVDRLVAQPGGPGQGIAHRRIVVGQRFQRRQAGILLPGRAPRGVAALWLDQGGVMQLAVAVGQEGAHPVVTVALDVEYVVDLGVDEVLDMPGPEGAGLAGAGQRQAVMAQQLSPGGVGGQQGAVLLDGDQVAPVDLHELPGAVQADDMVAIVALQEVGVLDHPRIVLDHLKGKGLGGLGLWRPVGGDVEHRQQLAVRVKDRRCRAGQADVMGTEVVAVVTGQRHLLLDAGPHRARPGTFLAPVGA